MKQLLFSIILFALAGCSGMQKDTPPADLIAQGKMIQVLVDIHVADAVVENKSGAQNPNLPLTNALYEQIYKNHGITATQYKTSFKYYESHAELMDKMYEQVITELSKKEAQMKK